MPSYEFECVGCHFSTTVEGSIHDEVPKITCEYCESKMYRVYSAPAIQFKAKDFYKTTGG